MNDSPQASQQNGAGEDNHHLVHEGHAMRSVVRNIVANMESVLNDLHGIMGDIQSLVVQIDTVTDKIDQQCGPQADNNSSPKGSEHCVRKPEFVHGRKPSSGAVHNMLYSHADPEKNAHSLSESLTSDGDVSSHNVLQVKAFRTDNIAAVPALKRQPRLISNEVSAVSDKKKEIRLPCSSKRFSHFPKEGAGVTSPSGGIAIVYPTIKCKPSINLDTDYLEPVNVGKTEICKSNTAATKTSDERIHFEKSFLPRRNKLAKTPQQVMSKTPLQDNEAMKSKHMAAKQRYGITSVYNKFFQPVTPTEQRSPVIPIAHRHGQTKASFHENVKSLVPTNESKPYRVSYPIPEKSSTLNSPGHKYCTIGSALAISLKNQRESSLQRLIPSSPLLRRSTTKPVYSKVQGSPASTRSPGTIRRLGTENYYFSIESDLDSDALIENIDNRTMTPDIDWSYLNLVGNENFIAHSSRTLDTTSSDHMYEIPVTAPRVAQPFQMLQTSPDVVARLPAICFQTPPAADTYTGRDSSFMFHGQGVLVPPFNNTVVAHIFCSEVSSFKANGYCGCYESVLDSVLENIAGFESFEEACENINNDEAVIDTYVSFDDEFEEDDWDVGMKSDDQSELDSCNIGALYHYEHDFFERLDTPDDNRNVFAAIDNTVSFRLYGTDTENMGCVVLTGSMEGYKHNANHNSNKRRLSPVFSDNDVYDRLVFPETTGNSFGDDDCCAIKPNIVNTKHENFILLRKSFIPHDLRLFNDGRNKIMTDCETEMSSSDDTSCQAIGTGSPMSFSSPEAALTSPDTDRFVTSSEGDDLFTSQEEGYFHFSDTQDNANMSVARANMLQLRREFFESLYNVCDKRDRERLQDNNSITIPEENIRYDHGTSRMDNSRDNISESGSYQEDITSYNKNINTWTAYACVHIQSDDISDSTSDIFFNDNNINCSMTSSYLDADNIGTAPGSQGLSC